MWRRLAYAALGMAGAFAAMSFVTVKADDPFFGTQAIIAYRTALTDIGNFGAPRYTTALLPACGTTNKGAVNFDTTVGAMKVCDGSSYVTVGGSSLAPGGSDGQLQYRVNSTTLGGITNVTTSAGAVTRLATDPSLTSTSSDCALKIGSTFCFFQEAPNKLVLSLSGSVVSRWSGNTGAVETTMDGWLTKTANYTRVREDSGRCINNTGAIGSVTITEFNNPWVGMTGCMQLTVAQPFCLAPNTGETLYFGSTGPWSTVCSSSKGASLSWKVSTDASGAQINVSAAVKESDWTGS
jgi:hypothetical protein